MPGPQFTASGILLRRVAYGDADLILTLLTAEHGKMTLIAKSARKSTKRFVGVLELFSALRFVGSTGSRRRRGGMPVLQEATLQRPFAAIRGDIRKTGYASYWAELVHDWVEDRQRQPPLYALLWHALAALDEGQWRAPEFNVLFQLRFLLEIGMLPVLDACTVCRTGLDRLPDDRLATDLKRGGLVCRRCASGAGGPGLSRGTLKQLQWMASGGLDKALRMRLDARAESEGQAFLEAFVPFHLGRMPRSLRFLNQIR